MKSNFRPSEKLKKQRKVVKNQGYKQENKQGSLNLIIMYTCFFYEKFSYFI